MSAPKYRYGHGTSKRRSRKALLILGGSTLLVALVAGVIVFDLRKSASPAVEGEGRVISQVLSDNAQQVVVDEPFFSFKLPSDWKEISRNETGDYDSINYQATAKGKDNRYLTVYVDRIPHDKPFNRIVTVRAVGSGLSYDDVSDNCANFTVGGTQDGRIALGSKAVPTKWNRVDFNCNLPQAIDNQIGTGAEGSPNAVTVTGPNKGTHKYFFLYIDRNFQPDYTILYDALTSFRAK